MKPFTSAFALTVFCLAAASVEAQDFSWSPGPSSQQVLNEMVASRKYRPLQTAPLETFEMPLVLDGKPSGTVMVKAGTPLNVVDVKTDGVVIELRGNQTKLPIEKTDLIARYADRKKEVDQQFEKERQDLIVAGEEIVVLPPPVPVAPVQPLTQVVYVDSSQQRFNMNTGNYWPYSGSYPYATSYVLPYYQPYYYPVNRYCYPNQGGRPAVAVPTTRPAVQTVVHPFAPARIGQ